VNVADVEPCATVTLAGTLAAVVLELDSDTATPPVPAASVRLTVPVPDWPLTIVLGLTETLLSAAAGGLTVTPNVLLPPE
jgi:FlaG/FlaF family flagellin (archaellin)